MENPFADVRAGSRVLGRLSLNSLEVTAAGEDSAELLSEEGREGARRRDDELFPVLGKTSEDGRYHLLPYHCLDVAAVVAAWWDSSPTIRRSFVEMVTKIKRGHGCCSSALCTITESLIFVFN